MDLSWIDQADATRISRREPLRCRERSVQEKYSHACGSDEKIVAFPIVRPREIEGSTISRQRTIKMTRSVLFMSEDQCGPERRRQRAGLKRGDAARRRARIMLPHRPEKTFQRRFNVADSEQH